jgi:hypothetical protein
LGVGGWKVGLGGGRGGKYAPAVAKRVEGRRRRDRGALTHHTGLGWGCAIIKHRPRPHM